MPPGLKAQDRLPNYHKRGASGKDTYMQISLCQRAITDIVLNRTIC